MTGGAERGITRTSESRERCPNCGKPAVVVYDSRMVGGERMRRRKCVECKHRYATVEIDMAVGTKLRQAFGDLDRALESLSAMKAQLIESGVLRRAEAETPVRFYKSAAFAGDQAFSEYAEDE